MVKSSILLSKINRRKIVKNLGQFASIIIITLLAVCLSVGLNSSANTLEKKLDILLEESNYADGIVYGLIEDDTILELDLLVYEYQKRLELQSKSGSLDSTLLISDGQAYINKPFTDNYIEGVYVTHYFASLYDLSVGDTFVLSVDMSLFFSELSSYTSYFDSFVKEDKENIFKNDNVDFEFKISGLMYHPEGITESLPISLNYSIFQETFKDIINDNFNDSDIINNLLPFINSEVYNSVLFKGDFDLVKNNDYFNDYFIFNSEYNSGLMQLENDITQAFQLTYVFPVVFILVSILIIITTISQLIFKEKLNIATLKSIGISNKEIYIHYMLLTISLCMIGGVVGAIVGPMIIPNVMGIKYGLLYFIPDVNNIYPIFSIITNILLFVLISSIVSFFILRSSVNTLPAALIKNASNHKFKKSKLKIKSWSTKIALRNISQNVFRSLMVIIGVGGCAALFITGFGIDDTLNNTINLDLTTNYDCNANISFDNYSNDLFLEIQKDEYLTYYEEFSVVVSTIEVEIFNYTNVFIVDDNTKVFNQGDFDGVYISSKTSDLLNISIADVINVTIDNIIYEIEVEYIIETGFTHGLFIPKSLVDTVNVTNAWIKTDNQELTDEYISSLEGVNDVYTNNEFQQAADESLGPISIIKVTLQIFAILLGIVVLYNLALLNYKERNRDIATLKVLGLTNLEIAKSLIYEMMILAIFGGLFGLTIGYPMLVLLLSINEVDFVTYIYDLTMLSYFKTFMFTTLTALIINLILLKQIDKIKMVESLKSVE